MVIANPEVFIQQDNVFEKVGKEFATFSITGTVFSISKGQDTQVLVSEANPIQVIGESIEMDSKAMVPNRPYPFVWDGVAVFAMKRADDTIDFFALRDK